MDTKNLISKQVFLAHELSNYHFQIEYYEDKANRAADALSKYFQ